MREDPKPSKRVDAFEFGEYARGDAGATDAVKAVAARDVIAVKDFFLARRAKADGGFPRGKIVHAYVFDLEKNRQIRFEARGDQILDHFLLRIDRDGLAPGEVVEIDAMAFSVEAQLDPVMREAFALEALADSRFDQQIDGTLFEEARTDALFDVFSAPRFEDDRLDPPQVKEMGEHQPRGTCPDYADLRAHVFPFVAEDAFRTTRSLDIQSAPCPRRPTTR